MQRLTISWPALSLAGILAGCGGGGNTKVDLGRGDMVAPPDLASLPDLAMHVTGAFTGEPCMVAKDCRPGKGTNQRAACLTMTEVSATKTVTWKDGACTSTCRPAMNKTDGNPDCPTEDPVVCTSALGAPQCLLLCDDMTPCVRAEHGCFNAGQVNNMQIAVCLDKGFSDCNPKMAKSCPDEMAQPRTCIWQGPRFDVGSCMNKCNPFEVDAAKNGCPAGMENTQCHLQFFTGEGICIGAGTKGAGEACMFFDDCKTGYGCIGNPGKCFKNCNRSNAMTQCKGGSCMVLRANPDGAGICTASD